MSYQILLVDDDSDFREELRECLEDDYKILEASNARQALDILSKPNAIDIIILDVVMPGLSGTEALHEFKRCAAHVGIIMLTGQSSTEVAIEALKGRADDFIEKPFSIKDLREAIERILKNAARHRGSGSNGTQNKMEHAKFFIERNYDRKIRLEDIAKEVCLSPKYISRAFKEQTGYSFNDYRLKIKMTQAQKTLKNSDHSVGEIARQFGYQNVESFVRLFKKMTGETPTEFRSRQLTRKKK